MTGTISLENVRIHCIIGELEHERTTEQELLLDIEYQYNIQKVAETDDINASVDYSVLSKIITDFIISSKFKLLETLCVKCCSLSMDHFDTIDSIRIRAKKPDALHNIELCCAEFSLSRQ